MKIAFQYLRYLGPHKVPLLIGILCGLAYGLSSGFGVPYFMHEVFKEVLDQKDLAYSQWEIAAIAALLPITFLARGIAGYANQYLLNLCAHNILKNVRHDLFKKLNYLPLAFHDRHLSGDLMSRLASDSNLIQHALLNLANELVRQPATMIAAFGFLGYLSYQNEEVLFILLLFAIAPLTIILVKLIGRHLKKRGREAQEAMGDIFQQMHENLNAVLEVRTFNLQEREAKDFDERLEKFRKLHMKLVKYEKLSQPIMEIMGALLIAVCFTYAYINEISASIFLALGAALYFCIDPLKRLIKMQNEVQKCQGAFVRLEEIMQEENPIKDPENPVKLDSLKGEIVFEGISFAYEDEKVLSGVSTKIPAGSVCALVGPSGAGKSTFTNLIPRFYDSTNGSISIDGYNVRDLSKSFLRSQIGIVPQKPVLFNDSVFNNIQAGRPGASRDEVIEAAKSAHADEFIKELEGGYDALIGEDGTKLSGGQRQRIAIARAFLKNAPILILDEATSSLDSQSESMIQDALEKLVKNKTVIIIAHRFSTIKFASDIIVFEEGRIAAQGTHDELYNSSHLYQKLYDKQL